MKPMPPGYVALIERLAVLIGEWCAEQPGLPDLQWHEPGEVAFIGALKGETLKYLAKSPDAIRLLEWLDERTGGEATLIQATIALRHLGHLPGGRGEAPPHVTKQSAAMRAIGDFACETGSATRLPVGSPCPTCGKSLDAASGGKGHTPKPDDVTICVYCSALLRFNEALGLDPMTDAEIEALPSDVRHQMQEMADLLRAARTGALKRKRGVEA